MSDFDDLYGFYEVDPLTGELIYDTSDYRYITLRDAFAMSGVDIGSLTTEEELERVWVALGDNVMQVVMTRALNRDPNNLENALIQARIRGDSEEGDRIREKLRKRKALGLHVISNKPAH